MHAALWSLALALATGLSASAAQSPERTSSEPARLTAQLSPRNELVDRAQRQMDAGEFESAVTSLERAVDQADLSDAQLAEIYRLLSLCHLYLGDEDRARVAIERLLQVRPDYELPRTAPPKIRTLYGRIQDDVKRRRVRPVTVSVLPVSLAPTDGPVELQAEIDNFVAGLKARLYFRRAGLQSFSSTDFVRDEREKSRFRATVPAYEVPREASAYQLEYYVEVADAAQRRLAGRGDAFNPLALDVPASPGKSTGRPVAQAGAWYANPWVLAGIGLGVAAAATATALVVVASQDKGGQLPVTIQIQGGP